GNILPRKEGGRNEPRRCKVSAPRRWRQTRPLYTTSDTPTRVWPQTHTLAELEMLLMR
ncbi:hypothetical protein K523DRAFT_404744, partial [Schizophyllum commune Tattone D]